MGMVLKLGPGGWWIVVAVVGDFLGAELGEWIFLIICVMGEVLSDFQKVVAG